MGTRYVGSYSWGKMTIDYIGLVSLVMCNAWKTRRAEQALDS